MHIIVRTKAQYEGWSGGKPNKKTIGKMYSVKGNKPNGAIVYLAGGWTCKEGHYRLATKNEVIAYNKGIRHIKDIKNEEISYKIY